MPGPSQQTAPRPPQINGQGTRERATVGSRASRGQKERGSESDGVDSTHENVENKNQGAATTESGNSVYTNTIKTTEIN